MYNPMQMRYAEPDFKNERDDNDPDLIGFLRVEGSAMCEVSFYNIKFWKAYDTTFLYHVKFQCDFGCKFLTFSQRYTKERAWR